jgi:hypothetical protein
VARGLAADDELVVDVPAQLATRARLLNTGHARKTDSIGASSKGSSDPADATLPLIISVVLLSSLRDLLAKPFRRHSVSAL